MHKNEMSFYITDFISCLLDRTLLYVDTFISSYHQKLPYDAPQLELKATYGLVSPEPFKGASLNPQWTKEVYDKMDAKMAPKPENEVN